MSAINFPNNPVDGQYFAVENIIYKYDLETNSWTPISMDTGAYVRLFFGVTPPPPASNNMWWNTETGELYVFYQDGSSNQWVISTPTPTSGYVGSRGTTGFVGSTGDLGYSGSIGYTGSRGVTGYVGSAGLDGDPGTLGYTGSAGSNGTNGFIGSRGYTGSSAASVENFIVSATTSGTVEMDLSVTNVIQVSPTGNFSVNIVASGKIFTNGTTNYIVVIKQGATPYIPTVLLDGGSSGILWQGGTAPTGTANKTDVLAITVLRAATGYTVLGQLVSFG